MTPRWVTHNGIHVPVEYAFQRELMRRLHLQSVATWQDVSGVATSQARLEELAGQLNAESAITLFSVLATVQHNRRGSPAELEADQHSLATELLPPKTAAEIVDIVKRQHRHWWLHEEQLLAATRLVILYGQPGRMEAAPERDVLAELLLGINDHFRLDEPPGESEELQRMRMVLRPLGLLASEQERYLIPRFQDLLLVRARRQKSLGGLDLDAAFELATGGLSFEHYLAAALIYAMPFVNVHDVQSLAASNYREILALYEKRHRNASKARLCANQFVGTLPWYREQFNAMDARPLAYWDYMPFKQRPLIRLDENLSPIPISFSLLMQKLATGPYWLLHRHFAVVDPVHGVQNLNAVMGRVFESYAQELLERSFTGIAGAVFVPERVITGGHGIKKPDAVFQQGSAAIVFETSATALSEAAIVNSDPSAFNKEIAAKHQSKAAQLGKAIEALASGVLRAPGIDLSSVDTVYPVLLLLHPFPHFLFTVQPLREAIAEGPILGTAVRMNGLTVMSVEEMEMIEPVLASREVALADLLARRGAEPVTRDTSFKNFLLSSGIRGIDQNANMKQLYDDRLMSAELRGALHELFVFDDEAHAVGG